MSQIQLPHNHGQDDAILFDHMPALGEFQAVADIFKQLGDSSRIRIFWILCHCEECVMNLSALVEMSKPGGLAPSPAAQGERADRQPP